MTRVSLLFILTASLPPVVAQTPFLDNRSALSPRVASGSLSSLRWPDFSDYRAQIQQFYEPDYTFAWIRDGRVTGQAEAIIEILKEADAKGLNSEDYDGSRWADRLTGLSSASDSDFAEFDLALTVSVMRYISDLHFGRANPGVFRTEFDIENESVDLPVFLQQRLIRAADVRAVLEGIEPPYQGYRRTSTSIAEVYRHGPGGPRRFAAGHEEASRARRSLHRGRGHWRTCCDGSGTCPRT